MTPSKERHKPNMATIGEQEVLPPSPPELPQNDTQNGNEPQHPCVIVMRVPKGEGQEEIQIIPYNGIDELSIPLVLRIAADIKEKQIKGT